MPGMDGWQFRLELRRRPSLRDLPVIVLSADHAATARAIDADAFVQKPLERDQLLVAIERVLLTRERRRLMAKAIELEQIRSLGMAVAGMAHEINNPLTALLSRLELAERHLVALSPAVGEEGQGPLQVAACAPAAGKG